MGDEMGKEMPLGWEQESVWEKEQEAGSGSPGAAQGTRPSRVETPAPYARLRGSKLSCLAAASDGFNIKRGSAKLSHNIPVSSKLKKNARTLFTIFKSTVQSHLNFSFIRKPPPPHPVTRSPPKEAAWLCILDSWSSLGIFSLRHISASLSGHAVWWGGSGGGGRKTPLDFYCQHSPLIIHYIFYICHFIKSPANVILRKARKNYIGLYIAKEREKQIEFDMFATL